MEPPAYSDSDNEAIPEEIGKEIDISGDGKLKKIITKAGSGWENPSSGSEVTVHYTGTLLDGTKFDSSVDRGEPFVFNLGKGNVIKGWDEGVKTMKKGEVASLICDPDYAYGESGSPPTIPPNATLKFEIELISWTEWKILQKGIKKKILVEGSGWEKPEFDTEATVSWSSDKTEKVEHLKFIVGSEQIPPKLEVAFESMKKGEKSLIELEEESTQFELTLEDFEQAPKSWKLKGSEKIEYAKKRKDEGSELFKSGKFERAVKKYKAALEYANSEYEMDEEQKAEAKPLKVTLHLNLAACDLKTSTWSGVIEHANKALEISPGNLKALLRRGKAYNELDRWQESKQDLFQVMESTTPEAVDAKKEYQKLLKKMKEQDEKEKKLFSNLFGRLREQDNKENQKEIPPAPSSGEENA
jgi:FK506-binding protein 4/5